MSSSVVGTPLKRWFLSLRPYSFTASLMPVAVAVALSLSGSDPILWWTVPFFALSALLFHAGTNVLNDYYDFVHGVDPPGDPDPTHAITQGVVPARYMLTSGRIYFVLGVLAGSAIALVRGPLYLAAGLAGALGAFLYTSGRFSLKYRALGDVAAFLLMGPVLVALGVWALLGTVTVESVIASLPVAFLVTAILHGNNTRDIQADRAAGVDTVAIRLGLRSSKVLFAGLIALAFVVPVITAAIRLLPLA
ncbi:MAG: prenyltransferase, partial [Spirochaetaceae bacterium]